MSYRFWGTIPDSPESDTIRQFAELEGGLQYLLQLGAKAAFEAINGRIARHITSVVTYSSSKTGIHYLTLMSKSGLWLGVSKEFAARLGYTAPELLGRYPYEYMDEESGQKGQAVISGQPLPDDDFIRVFITKAGQPVRMLKVVSFREAIPNCPTRSLVVWQEIL